MKKTNRIPISEQVRLLKQYYPESEIKLNKNKGFTWIHSLQSSPMGNTYKVKIIFVKDAKPEVYVIDPEKLKLADGKLRLPHVYSHETQKLCLYYPIDNEWNEGKMIASTIIPWSIEWLYHYELWVITGKWLGGGIHPTTTKKKE